MILLRSRNYQCGIYFLSICGNMKYLTWEKSQFRNFVKQEPGWISWKSYTILNLIKHKAGRPLPVFNILIRYFYAKTYCNFGIDHFRLNSGYACNPQVGQTICLGNHQAHTHMNICKYMYTYIRPQIVNFKHYRINFC